MATAFAHGYPPLAERGMLLAMAREFGRVVTESSGNRIVHRIDCGTVAFPDGSKRRVRLNVRPSPISPGTWIAFGSRAAAEVELEYIRAAIASGTSPADAVIPYLPVEQKKAFVEDRVEAYLRDWRQLVDQGKKSPNSLRELERYADRYWRWWYGKDIFALKNRDVREWHLWLGEQPVTGRKARPGQRINPKTQKNISDAFRAFLRVVRDDENGALQVPRFPPIEVPDYAAKTITPERLQRILEAIPWDWRGAFLVIAYEHVRVSEAVAFLLEDWDGERLHIHRGRQGPLVGSRVRHNKNRSAVRRRPFWPELVKWLDWRLEQTSRETRAAGRERALFWNPSARNPDRAWCAESLRKTWRTACRAVGEEIPLQEGTRHTVLSRLAEVLQQRPLQERSRHRSAKSLEHYTVGAGSDPVAMVHALQPKIRHGSATGQKGSSQVFDIKGVFGGTDGT